MRKVSKRLLVRSLVVGMIVLAIYFTREVSRSLAIICPDEKAKKILKDLVSNCKCKVSLCWGIEGGLSLHGFPQNWGLMAGKWSGLGQAKIG